VSVKEGTLKRERETKRGNSEVKSGCKSTPSQIGNLCLMCSSARDTDADKEKDDGGEKKKMGEQRERCYSKTGAFSYPLLGLNCSKESQKAMKEVRDKKKNFLSFEQPP